MNRQNTDNFFDFTDFFNLVYEHFDSTKEDLFKELTEFIYTDADHTVNSIKDDMYDITRKRKAFNDTVRSYATLEQLEPLKREFGFTLIHHLIHQSELSAKLLFLVQKDQMYFDCSDYDILNRNKQDISYILAYLTLKTISLSLDSKKYRHTKDYNPFKDYHFLPPKSNLNNEKVVDDLIATSLYIYNKYTQTNIESRLLSNGYLYSTPIDSHNLVRSFTIIGDANKAAHPLNDFLNSRDNLLIIGEGGIGKTTFLFSYLNDYHNRHIRKSIPIYVRLSECSTNTDHQHMILNNIMYNISFALNGHPVESYKDLLDEFSIDPYNEQLPAFTLLLDGFNEITTMDMGQIRSSIASEINELVKLPNIRIILTTRESDMYGLHNDAFTVIKANGIDKKDVIDYLSEHYSGNTLTRICENESLLSYLQLPLFLKMFTCYKSHDGELPQTRGEILYYYYNSTGSIYNEKDNSSDKNDIKTSLLINFLLDFFLPELSFYMTEQDTFSITIEEFETIVENVSSSSAKYITISSDLVLAYSKRPNNLSKVINLFNATNFDDILIILSDYLSILTSDSENRIYFCHQYIRDYFSALFCIREIHYLSEKYKSNPISIQTEPIYWAQSNWSSERIILISEILHAAKTFQNEKLLTSALKMLKDYNTDVSTSRYYAVSNIINTLSHIYNGDLSEFDFSNLDLTHCQLATKNFHNPFNKISSNFSNTTLSQGTFAPEAHDAPIKKWCISSDERYIASISTKQEIKLWNIANQQCIGTWKYAVCSYYEKIKDFKYYSSHDLMLFTTIDDNLLISSAWSFNTHDGSMCYYFTHEPEHEHFIYFDYDIYKNKLIGISDYGNLYYYSSGEEWAEECITIDMNFCQRMSTEPLHLEMRKEYSHLATKRIQIMANDKLLYIESDVFPPYLHTICNQFFKGPDYALEEISQFTDISAQNKIHDNGERHINLFIYDINTDEIHPLQLDCTPNEITTLVLNSSLNEDILNSHIAITNDRTRIILHNQNDIYVYNIHEPNYQFINLCKLPHYFNFNITFCNNNTITLYDSSNVIQIDINSGEYMQEFDIGQSNFYERISCTSNYRLFQMNGNTTSFRITNLYSRQENLLLLNDIQTIVTSFMSNDRKTYYCLFSNGTLYALNAFNMRIEYCYNLCPDKHIISLDLNPSDNLICFATSAYHSLLFSNNMQIQFFDIVNGKINILPNNFDSVRLLKYVCNGKFVIACTSTKIYVISVFDKCITDAKDSLLDLYTLPESIIEEKEMIHFIYSSSSYSNNHEYFGRGYATRISDSGKLQILGDYRIPIQKLNELPVPVKVKQFGNSSLCLIKSDNPSNYTLKYIYSDEYNGIQSHTHLRSINEWCLVYLDVDTPLVLEDDILPLRDCDFHLLNNVNDSYYLLSDKQYTYYSTESDTSLIRLDIGNNDILYCSEELKRLYLSDPQSYKLYEYDILDRRSQHSSPYLHPNMLIWDCNFSNIKGFTGEIPHNLIHKDNADEPLFIE